MPKVLIFSGSARKESVNNKLCGVIVRMLKDTASRVTHINLADYDLPIYDGDLEEKGVPENVIKLKQLFDEHDSLVVVTPEYNACISPLLKNTLDWVSRPTNGESRLSSYKGKISFICSASTGAYGGIRALGNLRNILSAVGVFVMPDQLALPKANDAYDEAGNFNDADNTKRLRRMVDRFIKHARFLNSETDLE